nr:CpaF family protein [uncultured Merdimonas sp.]
MIRAEQLHARIMDELDMTREVEDEELTQLIYQVLREASMEEHLSLEEKTALGKELFNAFRKLDLLQEFLEDEEITEIMINGTEHIFYEKGGRLYQSDRRFVSREKLEDVIQQIVAGANRLVNEASPIVDARLADGSRVNVVLAPVALNGPIVTIRKFSKEAASMEQLVAWGSVSQEMSSFLGLLVASGYNIFISGGTGSGKTTFLNALSQYIPKDERIITIEDNAELKIRGIPNLVSLEARNANVEGTGAVTIRDLIKAALRMRPTRIIVGEVRSAEAIDMLQALNTGHDGSLSTGHANSPRDMLSRLETMVLMGMELPLPAIQRQIASGIDLIVHLGRLRDKSRKVLEVTEVLGYIDGEIRLQTLYQFEEKGVEHGRIQGVWKKCQELTHRDKLLAAGYDEAGVGVDRS